MAVDQQTDTAGCPSGNVAGLKGAAMKRLILLLMLLVGAFAAGCEEERALSPSGGRGLADTQAERHRRIETILDMDARMLQDDVDMFWLFDRNLRLTQWHVLDNE
jgi:hypothetical protein